MFVFGMRISLWEITNVKSSCMPTHNITNAHESENTIIPTLWVLFRWDEQKMWKSYLKFIFSVCSFTNYSSWDPWRASWEGYKNRLGQWSLQNLTFRPTSTSSICRQKLGGNWKFSLQSIHCVEKTFEVLGLFESRRAWEFTFFNIFIIALLMIRIYEYWLFRIIEWK